MKRVFLIYGIMLTCNMLTINPGHTLAIFDKCSEQTGGTYHIGETCPSGNGLTSQYNILSDCAAGSPADCVFSVCNGLCKCTNNPCELSIADPDICNAGQYKNNNICTDCPTCSDCTSTNAVTSPCTATDITKCYIKSDTSFSNTNGTGTYTSNCNYSE